MITNKDISIDSENGKITLNGNKYDLGTQGEIDTAVKDVYSVMGKNGAKNLIHFPYDYSSRPTLSGITYTINADGSITMNGTTTARSNYWLYDHGQGFMGLESGDYMLSKTGRTDVGFIVAFYKGSTWVKQVTATVNDMKVSIDVNSNDYDNIGIAISFGAAGITVENATVYPMLRLAADTDNTYEPYAMTNKQLTEQVADVKGTIGDLTQTGVTGADVAAQIGALETAITDVDAYTVSDITDLNQSITVNEFSLRKCGKIVTLGLNFSVSASIPVFTTLFKLPSGILSYGRTDATGVFTTKVLQATLGVSSTGEVLANTSIDTGSYYNGFITFILKES